MSRHDDAFAGCALPEHFREFGQSVTYKDPEGDPATITAIVGEVNAEPRDDEEGAGWIDTLELTIGLDPDDADHPGVRSPRRSAGNEATTVTVAGRKWTVVDVAIQAGGLAVLRCEAAQLSALGTAGR